MRGYPKNEASESVGDFKCKKLCIVLILGHFYIGRICAKAIKSWMKDRMCASFLGLLYRHIHHHNQCYFSSINELLYNLLRCKLDFQFSFEC